MASIDHPNQGCMLGWHEDRDDILGDPGPALGQREERLRKKFASYRLFRQWERTDGQWKKLDELVGQGKLVLISHKGPKFDGGFDPVHGLRSWQYIAAGKADAYVIDNSEGTEGWIQSFADDPFFLDTPSSLRTG